MTEFNLSTLFECAIDFAKKQNLSMHAPIKGVTDGKALGTYVEHLFNVNFTKNRTLANI